MLHICLFEPEIPPNTGNIIRLCANIGASLHLIHPLGFALDTKQVKRAGLDYHEMTCVTEYQSWTDFIAKHVNKRLFAATTKANTFYSDVIFKDNDVLVFGPETRGLPEYILDKEDVTNIKIPMIKNSRSLNLSNSVAIISYAALQNLGFKTW